MRLYGTIAKVEDQDDGSIKVYGVASAPSRDAHGEVVTTEAMAKAIDGYMRFPAVREMHDATKAAGRALEMSIGDAGETNIVAHVVDPLAITKVKAQVYAGFSIGGRVTKRSGQDRTIIDELDLVEVSLVDRPSCPDAAISLWKADDAETDDDTQANDDPAKADTVAGDVDAIMKAINANLDRLERGNEEKAAPRAVPACLADGIELRKGLYGVSRLASILSDLSYAIFDADCEAQIEADNSPVPATLRQAFTALVAAYKAMSDEEIAELTAAVNGETVARAAAVALTDLAKIEGNVPCADILAAAAEPLLVKGVVFQERTDAARDTERLAKTESDLAASRAANDDLTKTVSGLRDQLVALADRVEKLAAMPMPAKTAGSVAVVEKVDDAAGTPAPRTYTEDDLRAAFAAMPADERANVLMRAALRRPSDDLSARYATRA